MLWYQNDGAPALFSLEAQLIARFADRIIARGGYPGLQGLLTVPHSFHIVSVYKGSRESNARGEMAMI